MLAGLGSTAAARGGILSSNPLDFWLAWGLILDGNKPVNLLKWWSQQKRAGNTHGGLCKSWICSSLDRYGQGSRRAIQAGRRAWNGQSSGTRACITSSGGLCSYNSTEEKWKKWKKCLPSSGGLC
ncbi:hypothetical protein PSTG_06753 [Puccinia striiformis f. sp. tritici PST-78]|uniref:Uncharacterized protein n=1 Tax=Puccinia striiformis f. sp. tritici PST-78 TaxID=1165861 RepID=A0A0L0VKV5_9BASI|nr:hypothetical protein PSTG_06753 [Puccinia striiformis f. sp. tritici PST-78]